MSFEAGGFDTDIMAKVLAQNVFDDKVFQVYDPASLVDLLSRMNPPICGVVYEGIVSDGDGGDTGSSTYLSVGVIVLGARREQDIVQAVDKGGVATLLDSTRAAIFKTDSPAHTPWEFVMEVPMEIGSRDLGYYQKWRTKVAV